MQIPAERFSCRSKIALSRLVQIYKFVRISEGTSLYLTNAVSRN